MSRPWGRFARSKARQGDSLRHQIPAPCPHSPLTGFTLIGALWHDIFECNISQAIIKPQITFYPTMLSIETQKPWARLVIHQSLTTTVVKIVRLRKSTLSPDELTCSVRSKRRDQNQSDNREINDKLNPLYTLFTAIHDD